MAKIIHIVIILKLKRKRHDCYNSHAFIFGEKTNSTSISPVPLFNQFLPTASIRALSCIVIWSHRAVILTRLSEV
ncbi:MAG: hypothetical protein ACKO96_29810, partial [Flammeovirgaceae bacterium]